MADSDKSAEDSASAELPTATSHTETRLSARACAWPIGDPGKPDFHFCEAPALEGKPYCREHAERAYTGKPKDGKAA